MKLPSLLLGLSLLHTIGIAQTYTGTGGPITDDASVLPFSLKVAGLPPAIDATFGLESVTVNIVHTWDKDLELFLLSPDGTVVNLSLRNGDGEDNYTGTVFTDTAHVLIDEGEAPFRGPFRPETPLGGVNNGQNPNGAWKLLIHDNYPKEETGKLVSWSLRFGKSPGRKYTFTGSDLPIMVITSGGKPILDEPKTSMRMGIIDNGPGKLNNLTDSLNGYNGFAGLESRGNSTQRHPKLSYSLELQDSAGEDLKAELLGMPRDADWILVANYSDKSLLRNALTYALYEQLGHYAPRTRFVELVIDGQYRGVYQLVEKLEKGEKRIDIPKLDKDDNAGDSITGGYIIKTDWEKGSQTEGWISNYKPMGGEDLQYWQFHYPSGSKITIEQKEYIAAFVDSMETACIAQDTDTLTGYPHFIDVASFIDAMIMIELAKNVDGYWVSSYYYKDKITKGGRLHAGPIWDYDLGYGNFEFYYGYSPAGWHYYEYGTTSDNIPQFWFQLIEEQHFRDQVKCRWIALRKTTLSLEHINAVIDSLSGTIAQGQKRNFEYWPILGTEVWPNAKPFESDYNGEIRRLKEWFVMRLAWMDAYMPGECN